MIERHYGRIVNGKIIQTERNAMRYNKALLRLEGREVEWVICEKQHHANNSLYAFYHHGIIATCLTTETFGGWTAKEIADYFESEFLHVHEVKRLTKGGSLPIHRIEQMSNLSTKEMGNFLDAVIRWLATHGISIGSPDEYKL